MVGVAIMEIEVVMVVGMIGIVGSVIGMMIEEVVGKILVNLSAKPPTEIPCTRAMMGMT